MGFNSSQCTVFTLCLVVFVFCASSYAAFKNDIVDHDEIKWSSKVVSSKEDNNIKFTQQTESLRGDINDKRSSSEDQSLQIPSTQGTTDKIEFKTPSLVPNVFFTSKQTKDHVAIHYPNSPTNPNNRLPLDPEDAATLSSVLETTQKSIRDQYDDYNFFAPNGKKKEFTYETNGTKHEFIHSMDVTLDIVRHSFWDDHNIVFSPLSICNILAVLMLGAEGQTYDELAKVLRVKTMEEPFNADQDLKFHKTFLKLRGYLSQSSGHEISIEIATRMFADKRFHLKRLYEKQAQAFYGTPVTLLNFQGEGKYFQDSVNRWVEEETNGRIKTIVDEPPPPTTTLALVNAVYYKGDWEVPFFQKVTKKGTFHVAENETISVQMMTNVLTIPYFENEEYQMIAIPYKGNKTGFFVLLPKASSGVQGLKNLERKLSIIQPKDLENRLNQMRVQRVLVKLPKLKMTTDGHMKEILTNVGVPSMFQPDLANFSKITDDATIEVNERGTEAAAVTLATGDRIIEDPPTPFIANKPFMFFISHIHAKAVLFWGRVTRPEWK